jgi:hypothetical protein
LTEVKQWHRVQTVGNEYFYLLLFGLDGKREALSLKSTRTLSLIDDSQGQMKECVWQKKMITCMRRWPLLTRVTKEVIVPSLQVFSFLAKIFLSFNAIVSHLTNTMTLSSNNSPQRDDQKLSWPKNGSIVLEQYYGIAML